MRKLVSYHGRRDDLAGFFSNTSLGRPNIVQNQSQGQIKKRAQRSLTKVWSRRIFISSCQPSLKPSSALLVLDLSCCPFSTHCCDPQPTDDPLLSPLILCLSNSTTKILSATSAPLSCSGTLIHIPTSHWGVQGPMGYLMSQILSSLMEFFLIDCIII